MRDFADVCARFTVITFTVAETGARGQRHLSSSSLLVVLITFVLCPSARIYTRDRRTYELDRVIHTLRRVLARSGIPGTNLISASPFRPPLAPRRLLSRHGAPYHDADDATPHSPGRRPAPRRLYTVPYLMRDLESPDTRSSIYHG